MCGICGAYNLNQQPVDIKSLQDMLSALMHRGPSSYGYFIKGNAGLAAARLAVLDTSGNGDQPMFSADKRYCIVYNGELYNYNELKRQLEADYTFHSGADTEVALYSYIRWGAGCLERFRGMFAFAIFDSQSKELFIARDRFGIKPLYYFFNEREFIFSSELKAFKRIFKNLSVNDKAMYNYLVFSRTDYDEETFFEGIKRVPAGCLFNITPQGLRVRKWYDLAGSLKHQYASPGALRQGLADSVRLHLVSDVAVGVALSGGIDSSSVLSIMINDLNVKDIKTFSAVYGGHLRQDETRYIDEFKAVPGIQMHKVCLTYRDIMLDMDDFVFSLDEPAPQIGPLIQYEVMKLAHRNAVVLLSGQGADELFAGYHYFFGLFFKELLHKKRLLKLSKEACLYQLRQRSFFGIKSFFYFLMPKDVRIKIRLSENKGLSTGFLSDFKDTLCAEWPLYEAGDLKTSLIRHFQHKLEHLLKWEDRNSMRFSLESRVPFLDHCIVERALSQDSSFLVRNGRAKWILREALKDILPMPILKRQSKNGFDSPCADWFREYKFREYILSILNSGTFKGLAYFDYKQCLKVYKRHLEGRVDASRRIWKWINTELWYNRYIKTC